MGENESSGSRSKFRLERRNYATPMEKLDGRLVNNSCPSLHQPIIAQGFCTSCRCKHKRDAEHRLLSMMASGRKVAGSLAFLETDNWSHAHEKKYRQRQSRLPTPSVDFADPHCSNGKHRLPEAAAAPEISSAQALCARRKQDGVVSAPW